MSQETALALADAVLGLHIAAAAFAVFGLAAIPIGARLGWPFVRRFWWRLAHVVVFGTIALQKLLGEQCFLTVWENRLLALAGRGARPVPIVHTWPEKVIHLDVPLPFWLFVALYTGLWLYVVYLWFRVPPRAAKTHAPAA